MSAEFEMIAELTDGLAFGPDVRLGPGDDAAVLVPRGDIVITTDVPGCRETVTQDVNGCLIPARNVPALVAAMERYLTEPGLMERHGEASYQLALEKFDVRKVNVDILAATE